jgi:MFS superfamily sulfate permease-like transporter
MRHDLPAGFSVFLVALPLCLGIALASGAPLYSGIISGIVGGLVVSVISGSALAVSGPAAGLTTVVSSAIISLGDYRIFLLSVIVAGVFQILLGLLRFGSVSNYFPSAVIKGMLAAIGIILISKQIPLALGYDQPDFWRSGFLNLLSYKNFFGRINEFSTHAARISVVITIVSVVVMIVLKKLKSPILKLLPAPLLGVLGGIATNLIFIHMHNAGMKSAQLVNIPENFFNEISFPDFHMFFSYAVWKNGIVIGLLATLETLLCIEAIDKLDRHNRITPVNRELVAQGCGNISCGLLGGIPITAVIVRGAANVDAGARTKLSAFTHGISLLLAVLLVPSILSMIPYASLAAILLITGFNLTRPRLYKNMWQLGWKQFLPFMLTVIMILLTDLLIGVSIGLLLSVYFIIQNNFRAEYKIDRSSRNGHEVYYIRLNSNVTFLNKVKLRDALDKIPDDSKLSIDGSHCNFIDYDILEVISAYAEKARDRNVDLHLYGIKTVNVEVIH